ncbi:MAG: hypothetical protein AB1480_09975 [Nitrospirota bacterium]
MTGNRVNCFIAIKFAKPDTDAIYKKIKSIVIEFGLHPRRIDQIEHTENINQKIISELDESDITIADLTYARPSVYFEAGYSHRKTPVIYTCRKDHLNNEEDNLKVHLNHELNIKGRLILCKEIFEIIEKDFPIEQPLSQQPQWVELSMILEEELNYLENLGDQSNYGGKVLYAYYLNDFYKIYLETMTKLLQRPSKEYEKIYIRVKSGVEKLIRDIEKPGLSL